MWKRHEREVKGLAHKRGRDWHTRAKDWWAGEAGVRERGQVGEREGPVGERWAGGHETSAKLDIRL